MTADQLGQAGFELLKYVAVALVAVFITRLQNRNQKEKLELDAQKLIQQKFQERDAQFIEQQRQITELQVNHAEERGRLKQVIEANTEEMRALRNRLTELENKVLLLSSERDGLQAKLKETENKLAELMAEMQRKIDEAVEQIKAQYAEQINTLNTTINELRDKLQKTETQLTQTNAELEQTKATLSTPPPAENPSPSNGTTEQNTT